MRQQPHNERLERLRTQLRQLILMRETGPKRAAWQAARARLIWQLHEQLRQAEQVAEAAEACVNPEP
jgi:hypothetical protein